MKILSIEDNFSTHYENKFETGVNRVSKLLNDLLYEKGHDIISFCPSGSTLIAPWRIVNSTMPPKGKHGEGRYDAATYSQQAISVANNFEPDLIISHACRTDTTIKKLVMYKEHNPKCKVMLIQHGLPIGGPEQQNHVGLFQKLIQAGGNVVAVSNHCKDKWNTQYSDFKLHGLEHILPISDSFCFQFLE